ncbi:hypothetical protein J7E88_09890 [Streptomyces sp. ISL-10]|uniref:hypothetical protein n=1 Tax=Streptomyces sp. ISL-10 TaxID=2819172 RepID=UPI001BE928F2|nr:hypothetical protein [Streptomyces sp. ISL-10]MBT2365623.1 hypothetical protein [Streptomyces sp. ISL-10]
MGRPRFFADGFFRTVERAAPGGSLPLAAPGTAGALDAGTERVHPVGHVGGLRRQLGLLDVLAPVPDPVRGARWSWWKWIV